MQRHLYEWTIIAENWWPHAGRKLTALLDRAAFYLLWQGGLRLGEAEELCLEDLDLSKRRLTVRQGKGRKDRTVYLTDTAVRAMQSYMAVRGMGPTSHVFLYHNKPVSKNLIHNRIKSAGKRVGVKVSPHPLRHTFATQLLNAGCRVTTIQRLMGHRRLTDCPDGVCPPHRFAETVTVNFGFRATWRVGPTRRSRTGR